MFYGGRGEGKKGSALGTLHPHRPPRAFHFSIIIFFFYWDTYGQREPSLRREELHDQKSGSSTY